MTSSQWGLAFDCPCKLPNHIVSNSLANHRLPRYRQEESNFGLSDCQVLTPFLRYCLSTTQLTFEESMFPCASVLTHVYQSRCYLIS